jgi:elongation of very long chain fatty acids protein 4
MVYGIMVIPRYDSLFGTNTLYNDSIRYFLEVHYLSKYLDFFDTIFMAFRKKGRQILFLQVYHHTSICYVWGGFLTLVIIMMW